jgi:hypothetical protein
MARLFASDAFAMRMSSLMLSAALSAHGSAAVLVDEAAMLGVAEPKAGLLLGLRTIS